MFKKLEKFVGFNNIKINKLVFFKILKLFVLSSIFLEELEFELDFKFDKVNFDLYYELIVISK